MKFIKPKEEKKMNHEMNHEVNTAMERDCGYMDGMKKEQIHGAIGDALADFDEAVNVIVSGLKRLDSGFTTSKVMKDVEDRIQWARETVPLPPLERFKLAIERAQKYGLAD
jgi:hypothetical protein